MRIGGRQLKKISLLYFILCLTNLSCATITYKELLDADSRSTMRYSENEGRQIFLQYIRDRWGDQEIEIIGAKFLKSRNAIALRFTGDILAVFEFPLRSKPKIISMRVKKLLDTLIKWYLFLDVNKCFIGKADSIALTEEGLEFTHDRGYGITVKEFGTYGRGCKLPSNKKMRNIGDDLYEKGSDEEMLRLRDAFCAAFSDYAGHFCH